MPRTEKYGCVIEAGGDGRKPSQKADDCCHSSKPLLKPGEDKESSDLNPVTIPIKLMLGIDPDPVEVF